MQKAGKAELVKGRSLRLLKMDAEKLYGEFEMTPVFWEQLASLHSYPELQLILPFGLEVESQQKLISQLSCIL